MWTIPKIWEGGDVYIIGGGHSIIKQFKIPQNVVDKVRSKQSSISAYSKYLAFLHNKHVIGVNQAFKFGNWVDILFYGDNGFFLNNQYAINKFSGIKIGCHNKTKYHRKYGIKYVPRDPNRVKGLTKKPNYVSWNLNSGACAINLAYHLGAKRVFLIGFDMNRDKHNQHYHNEYRSEEAELERKKKNMPFARHLKSFPAIKRDAKNFKLDIININPDSQIKEFPTCNIDDL